MAVHDLITIEDLNEDSILQVLQQRYNAKLIYTYTGTILVALNPFCELDIYGTEIVAKYRGRRLEHVPPHIYALAESAFANLAGNSQQSIIISGESGAGKSETTKLVLQYLTSVTAQKGEESWIEQQILESNTVLESFGNAKTLRNNNSSRFGKFIQVHFDESNVITGASFKHYLLEKSRVARLAPGERNYHIFYELVKGATQAERQTYRLLTANQYAYLAMSNAIDIAGVNDSQSFSQLKLAMQVLNFDGKRVDAIFRMLSAVLSIGNIQFVESDDKESVKIHQATDDALDTVSDMLRVDRAQLVSLLLARRLVVRNETSLLPYKLPQALDNRDAVARILYNALFDHVVDALNASLEATSQQAAGAARKAKPAAGGIAPPGARFIGVLDIFGFEMFPVNSFEQLCINFTNEKLQQVFVQLIFKFEQAEYEKERIDWSALTFSDNVPCIELLESKGGVYAMLDEELKVPKGSDETWVEKMHNCHGSNPYYFKPRANKNMFGIKHYAGEVAYTSTSFLEKNRDAVPDEVTELFSGSGLSLLVSLFKPAPAVSESKDAAQAPNDGAGKKVPPPLPTSKPGAPTAKRTAGSSFRQSLQALIVVLTETATQFVRCIKPNQEKAALVYNPTEVLNQLRYTGMLDTIRIRRDGYPKRFRFEEFCSEFRFLVDKALVQRAGPEAAIRRLAADQKLGLGDMQVGATKVFLKSATSGLLSERNSVFLVRYVVVLQAAARMMIARQRYMRQRRAAALINRMMRGWRCRQQYRHVRRAVIKLQALTRGWMARCFFAYLKQQRGGVRTTEDALAGDSPAHVHQQQARELEALNNKIAAAGAANGAGVANFDALFGFLASSAQGAPAGSNEADASQAKSGGADELAMLMDQLGQHIDVVRKNVKDVNARRADAQRMADMGNKFARLVERQMASDRDAEKVNPDNPALALNVYATRHLNKYYKYKASAGSKKPADPATMLTYEKGQLVSALHKIYDVELNERALECYRNLLKAVQFSKDASEEAIAGIRCFIHAGIEVSILRDELYVQLIKQTNFEGVPMNPELYDQLDNAWFVASQCSACFAPTKKLSKVWLAYLLRVSKEYEPFQRQGGALERIYRNVQRAEANLKHCMVHGARRLPPSLLEIYCNREFATLPCRLHLSSGTSKAIGIGSTTTTMEAMKMLASSIDLRDPSGWGIYEHGPDGSRHLKAVEYLCDRIAEWEKEATDVVDGDYEGYKTVRRKGNRKARHEVQQQLAAMALGQGDKQLRFRRRLFRANQAASSDPVEVPLLFHQVSGAIQSGGLPVPTLAQAVKIAGMLCHVNDGPYNPETRYPNNFGLKYIPKHLWENEEVKGVVASVFVTYMDLAASSSIQAMSLFLEFVKSLPLYGVTTFRVRYHGFWAHSDNLKMAISSQQIQLLHAATYEVQLRFSYKDICSVELGKEVPNSVVIQVARTSEKSSGAEEAAAGAKTVDTHTLVNDRADEIVALIRDYSPVVAGKKSARDAAGDSAIDLETLERDLEKSRWGLLKHKLLNIPGPESARAANATPQNPLAADAAANSPSANGGLTMGAAPLGAMGTLAGGGGTLGGSPGARSPSNDMALPFGTVKVDAAKARRGKSSPTLAEFQTPSGSRSNLAGGTLKSKTAALTLKMKARVQQTVRGIGGREKPKTYEQEEYEPTREEQEAMYSLADWSFSRAVIPASLRALPLDSLRTTEHAKWAVQLYTILLIYAGIHPGVLPREDDCKLPYGHIVQSLMLRCLEAPEVTDELFLQLTKLTTQFPEVDAEPVLALWKILVASCGSMVPSTHVLAYVKAHLARYAAVPKLYNVDRKKEAELARYALRLLRKGALSAKRKNPPSIDELFYVMNMTPIRLRILFPDGQFRSFPVTPSATCRDALDLVEAKAQTSKLVGWDLFEKFAGVERPIARSESLVDLMYKWEAFKRGSPQYAKMELEFVYRRRFFVSHMMPSASAWEEEMMRFQYIEQIKDALVPLERAEAVYLVALTLQSRGGDAVEGSLPDYEAAAQAQLPEQHRVTGVAAELAKTHQSLRGIPAEKANALFMEYLRTWPFFGATIYEVAQSFTNELPPKVWLAVDINGVHLLPVYQKMAFASYPFGQLVNYSSSSKTLLLVAGSLYRGTKYVFHTILPHVICRTIKSYSDLARVHSGGAAGSSAAVRPAVRGGASGSSGGTVRLGGSSSTVRLGGSRPAGGIRFN